VGEVVGGELGADLALERAGVLGRDLEVDLGPGVCGDRCTQVAVELGEVLVGEAEREAVAARLGEHVLERSRQVQIVVDLVDVEGAIGPLVLGPVGAGERGLPHAGHDERAEQAARVLSERSLPDPVAWARVASDSSSYQSQKGSSPTGLSSSSSGVETTARASITFAFASSRVLRWLIAPGTSATCTVPHPSPASV
jgi:hypothetical protein